jgi:exosome complex RNA-binding protein Rrp42 (RNase PH superfamily)
MPSLLSTADRRFLLQGCQDGVRIDGRGLNEYRDYHVLQGVPLVTSNGSARIVSTHGLDLVASCKAEVVKPSLCQPDRGLVEIHVESYTSQVDRKQAEACQTLLNRLLADHLLDLHKLCILSGDFVWQMTLDIYILNAAGGSIIEAASHLCKATLQSTRLPQLTVNANTTDATPSQEASFDLVVNSDVALAMPPPGSDNIPVLVTLTLMPGRDSTLITILDASLEEESCAVAQVHVLVDDNQVVAMQTSGTSLPINYMSTVSQTAIEAVKQSKAYRAVHVDDKSHPMFLQAPFEFQ